MSKPMVILVDQEEAYAESLARKFAEEFGNQIQLSVITDMAYFQSFLSVRCAADVMLIDEKLYTDALLLHEIHRFILLGEPGQSREPSGNMVWMNRYENARSILQEAVYDLPLGDGEQESKKKETSVVAICSGVGGAGKTTLALALCRALAAHHKRVLYINTEENQNFGYYLKDSGCLDADGCRVLRRGAAALEELQPFIRREEFFYLPPLFAARETMEIPFEAYGSLVDASVASGRYDMVILDMDGAFHKEHAALMQRCGRIVIVTCQDALSAAKTEFLLRNMDCSDTEKYLFVCNQYDGEKCNRLRSLCQGKYTILEYIEKKQGNPGPEELCEDSALENLACYFL